MAPVPLSVVCFRWKPKDEHLSDEALDQANERLVDVVNATGQVFLSHTRLRGRVALRIAIGHIRTEERDVRLAWDLLREYVMRRPEM